MDYQVSITLIACAMSISAFVIGYVLGMKHAWADSKKW